MANCDINLFAYLTKKPRSPFFKCRKFACETCALQGGTITFTLLLHVSPSQPGRGGGEDTQCVKSSGNYYRQSKLASIAWHSLCGKMHCRSIPPDFLHAWFHYGVAKNALATATGTTADPIQGSISLNDGCTSTILSSELPMQVLALSNSRSPFDLLQHGFVLQFLYAWIYDLRMRS